MTITHIILNDFPSGAPNSNWAWNCVDNSELYLTALRECNMCSGCQGYGQSWEDGMTCHDCNGSGKWKP